MKNKRDKFFSEIVNSISSTNDLIENSVLSPFATRSKDAVRVRKEVNDKLRPPFERDRHRVIFSRSYRGYRGRTQVFLLANYQIADRMVHINYAAQISRVLAKALRLHIDLAEAIAVAHDLGHAPFGHDGERILNDISREAGIGRFHHNVHSVRVVDVLERDGDGLNLTFQVRDGLFSHDGEVHDRRLVPDKTKNEKKLRAQMKALTDGHKVDICPATLEACVMRMSDTIAYIGSDIEDAVRLNLIRVKDLPKECRTRLGRTNGQIIDSIISDIITNSYEKEYITFSDEISDVVKLLKKWNYLHIYQKFEDRKNRVFGQWEKERRKLETGLYKMFESFNNDIEKKNYDSIIYTDFLNKMKSSYLNDRANSVPVMVRDFITTMTDEYATEVISDLTVPKPLFQVIKWKKK